LLVSAADAAGAIPAGIKANHADRIRPTDIPLLMAFSFERFGKTPVAYSTRSCTGHWTRAAPHVRREYSPQIRSRLVRHAPPNGWSKNARHN
jgi:hypothetical protein